MEHCICCECHPMRVMLRERAQRVLASDSGLAMVIGVVCEHFRISASDLIGRKRSQHVAFCRQVGFYLSRTMTKRSFPEIGRFYGRDHSTVVHGYQKLSRQVKDSAAFRGLIHKLEIAIRSKQDEESRERSGAQALAENEQGAAQGARAQDAKGAVGA